ncbi:2-hydroxy-3-oxopropionate reductase [Tropicimonas isoalkanivorans]|uniref:2-hydroxy-3-oxopropionate reductase n=1 Tax=Tropicimonas isoalkanivorans TaxID=441112 RepID=A0A1I1K685_9RHOB|nr:2-hydroxy-3-oxopropionate reductase [Tropicimonas isoalkanivorans]SFC54228.1 2-hydroxy-3-oxopropionate reductase [Tropicimonas isoalkanivorans]
MSKLGFVGLGIMGGRMAANLQKGGHELFVCDIKKVPDVLVEGGAVVCGTPKEVAEKADVIFTMLPNTPDVEKVLFMEGGIAEGLSAGKIVVDNSSIAPAETRKFASKINELGCEYIDAPVSGGDVGAEAGTLAIMCGGNQEAFDRAKPFLDLMGKNVTLVGPNGIGQMTKICNQIIVGNTIEAVAEALLLAAKAGADPWKVRDALTGGWADSLILQIHGKRMIERNFEPGGRIELHRKDLNLALAESYSLGVPLPNTATTHALWNGCVGQGGIAWDHSAIVRALEAAAGFEIGQKP